MSFAMNTSMRRPNRKESLHSKKTLDIQHQTKLEELVIVQDEVYKLDKNIIKIDTKINQLQDDFDKSYNEKYMDDIIMLKDSKLVLMEKRNKLSEDNYIDYFLNTSDILYKYYDMVDNGGFSEITHVKPKENSILNWFSNIDDKNKDTIKCDEEITQNNNANNLNKSSLIDKYLQYTDKNYINKCDIIEQKCKYCNSCNVVTVTAEGYIECKDCGSIENIIVDHEKPSYKDPPKEISYWAYKRINHFKFTFIPEWNSIYMLVLNIIKI